MKIKLLADNNYINFCFTELSVTLLLSSYYDIPHQHFSFCFHITALYKLSLCTVAYSKAFCLPWTQTYFQPDSFSAQVNPPGCRCINTGNTFQWYPASKCLKAWAEWACSWVGLTRSQSSCAWPWAIRRDKLALICTNCVCRAALEQWRLLWPRSLQPGHSKLSNPHRQPGEHSSGLLG